jgi:hypothetical protein
MYLRMIGSRKSTQARKVEKVATGPLQQCLIHILKNQTSKKKFQLNASVLKYEFGIDTYIKFDIKDDG